MIVIIIQLVILIIISTMCYQLCKYIFRKLRYSKRNGQHVFRYIKGMLYNSIKLLICRIQYINLHTANYVKLCQYPHLIMAHQPVSSPKQQNTETCVCLYISTLAFTHREGTAWKRNAYNDIYSGNPQFCRPKTILEYSRLITEIGN